METPKHKLQLKMMVKPTSAVEVTVDMSADDFMKQYSEAVAKGDKTFIVEAIKMDPNWVKQVMLLSIPDVTVVIATEMQTGSIIDITPVHAQLPDDIRKITGKK